MVPVVFEASEGDPHGEGEGGEGNDEAEQVGSEELADDGGDTKATGGDGRRKRERRWSEVGESA